MPRFLIACLPALALIACGDNSADSEANAPTTPSNEAAQPSTSEAPGTDYSAVLAALGPEFAAADVSHGERLFRRCQACHQISDGGRNTVGPNLYGIIGQPAGAVPRFSYSQQLTDAGLVWDTATLDQWLASPRALVPGNRMSFVGLRDADDRRDLIAFMATRAGN
jgi:cytochrome c